MTKRARKRSSAPAKQLVNGKMKKGKYVNGIFKTFDQINAATAQAKKLAKEKLLGAQSVTEVGTSTAIVYTGAKSINQVNNGNKLRINGKVTTMPSIGGATWDFPLALISKDSKYQNKKK